MPAERDDRIADREIVHSGSSRDHLAGHLEARAERIVRSLLVQALNHQRIGEVQAARAHPHQDLAGCRLGRRQLAEDEAPGSAGGRT